MERLPILARRPRRPASWWRPGLPVHAPEHDDDRTLAHVVLAERRRCWHVRDPDSLDLEDGAMRWSPGLPLVRFHERRPAAGHPGR